jgi:regulatory subunit for Cdc7p protein kinase
LPAREENKKPGYCENCRIKFDDFSEHIVSRKHRRFALNTAHFKDLDTVLDRLIREPAIRAPSRFAPPPFKPAVRRPDEESDSEYSDEEDCGAVSDEEDGHQEEEIVPQWVLDELEASKSEMSQARRMAEEVDEIDDEDEELEVDFGDEHAE